MMAPYRRVAQLRTADQFRDYLASLGIDLPFDEEMQVGPHAPLAQPCVVGDFTIGNRWCVLPMEGWDGTLDGFPTDLTARRWQRFGISGAKLIWGGEAVAVRPDGRANPHQLMITEDTVGALTDLRAALVMAHEERYDRSDDLLIGLQLTHSGRFSRPDENAGLKPCIIYRHPFLDRKFGITDDSAVLSDDELDRLVEDFVHAAKLAQRAGFAFVDIKHCHGYLAHELLSAVDRPGKYGGSFENRTRFLREIVAGIRAEVPGLDVGVRLSAFDWLPFKPGEDGRGIPETYEPGDYPYAFGGGESGTNIDLTEPRLFLDLLKELDIRLVCITAGSPYYVPHIQRPALFPPSDGYGPPEDPLAGVARQIQVVAQLKRHRSDLFFVGSGYSYLQEWLPNVAQLAVRAGLTDFVGIGRLVLSYPEMPADVLAGKPLQRKRICRTFSDCTTAPRSGLVSGCYPLDEFYKEREEFDQLAEFKKHSRA
jgi:NADPH2 dehydrogenase